jgi:hypothetical protein
MKRRDITSLLELNDAFEKRLKVKLEGLSAYEIKEEDEDDHNVIVRGELHALGHTQISADIMLQLSLIDASGRVVATADDCVWAEKFFTYHTFEINCNVPPKTVAKLRLVPKAL